MLKELRQQQKQDEEQTKTNRRLNMGGGSDKKKRKREVRDSNSDVDSEEEDRARKSGTPKGGSGLSARKDIKKKAKQDDAISPVGTYIVYVWKCGCKDCVGYVGDGME